MSREDCAAGHVVPVVTWTRRLRERTSRRRDLASTEGVVQNQRTHDMRGGAWPRRPDTGGRGHPRRRSRIESRARHACFLRREVLRSNPGQDMRVSYFGRSWDRIQPRYACFLRGKVLRSNPAKTWVFLTSGGPEIESSQDRIFFFYVGRPWDRIQPRHACFLRREVLISNPAKTWVFLRSGGPEMESSQDVCFLRREVLRSNPA